MQLSMRLRCAPLLLVTACGLARPHAEDVAAPSAGSASDFPRLEESDGQLTVDLDGSSILRYSVQPLSLIHI